MARQTRRDNPPTKADRIRKKDPVPESDRTEDRDIVAEWIDEHLTNDNGVVDMRGTHMQDIAEQLGYSRQHIANTLNAYFVSVDPEPRNSEHDINQAASGAATVINGDDTIVIDIPSDVDRKSYLQGYMTCLTQT